MMNLSWNPRKNGFIPKNSYYTNKEILPLYPKLLVDFYESKLRFVPQLSKFLKFLNKKLELKKKIKS